MTHSFPLRAVSVAIGGGNRPGNPPFHPLTVGKPGELLDRIKHWTDLGFNHFILRMKAGQFYTGASGNINAKGVGWMPHPEALRAIEFINSQRGLSWSDYEGSAQGVTGNIAEYPGGPMNAVYVDAREIVKKIGEEKYLGHIAQIAYELAIYRPSHIIVDELIAPPDRENGGITRWLEACGKGFERAGHHPTIVCEPDPVKEAPQAVHEQLREVERYQLVTRVKGSRGHRPSLSEIKPHSGGPMKWYQLDSTFNDMPWGELEACARVFAMNGHHFVVQNWCKALG